MSMLRYSELLDPKGFDRFCATSSQVHDPDLAGPISAASDAVSHRLTTSAVNDYGEVEFMDEIDFKIAKGIALATPRLPEATQAFVAYGHIITPTDESRSDTLKKCSVVTAAWPYSRGWHDSACFKPRFNGSKADLAKQIAKEVGSRSDWRKFIRRCPEDIFSTKKDLRRAILIDPNRLDEDVGRGTRFHERPPGWHAKDDRKPIIPSCCWGLSKDLDECINVLNADSNVIALINQTINGTLFLENHSGHQKLDPKVNAKKSGSKAGGVLEKLTNHDVARKVLDAAIRLALAGPHSLNKFRKKPGRDGHLRWLVSTLVRDIYVELMFNKQKRLRAELIAPAKPPKKPSPEPPGPVIVPKTEIEALITNAQDTLAAMVPTEQEEVRDRALADFEMPDELIWEVYDDQPVLEGRMENENLVLEKLMTACIHCVALARLGKGNRRMLAAIRELSKDDRPAYATLGQRFLPLFEASWNG